MKLYKAVMDIKRNPSYIQKLNITEELVDFLKDNTLAAKEEDLAVQVIKLLARDSQKQIRKILAKELKDSKLLPKEVAMQFAHDDEDVAIPVLEYSQLFTEEDLVQIINSIMKVGSLEAIAKREEIGPNVTNALINTKIESVNAILMRNYSASFYEDALQRAVEYFKNSSSVMEAMVQRGDLPPSVVVSLVDKVADAYKNYLKERYDIKTGKLNEVAENVKQEALLNIIAKNSKKDQMTKFVAHLNKQKRLKPSIIMRAVCKGDIIFFVCALAELNKTSFEQIYDKVFKENQFNEIYNGAKLPKAFFAPIKAILEAATEAMIRNKTEEIKDRAKFSVDVMRNLSTKKSEEIKLMPFFVNIIKSKISTIDVIRAN